MIRMRDTVEARKNMNQRLRALGFTCNETRDWSAPNCWVTLYDAGFGEWTVDIRLPNGAFVLCRVPTEKFDTLSTAEEVRAARERSGDH